jgi:hypothetical protein
VNEIARPRIVALGVGSAMAALMLLTGFVIWRVLLHGGGQVCPEGMCVTWMVLGFWGSIPAFVFGAIAAGVTAHRLAEKGTAEIWRMSFSAGFVVYIATCLLAAAGHVTGFWWR